MVFWSLATRVVTIGHIRILTVVLETSMKERLMRGIFISSEWASIACSFQSNRENTNMVYYESILRHLPDIGSLLFPKICYQTSSRLFTEVKPSWTEFISRSVTTVTKKPSASLLEEAGWPTGHHWITFLPPLQKLLFYRLLSFSRSRGFFPSSKSTLAMMGNLCQV